MSAAAGLPTFADPSPMNTPGGPADLDPALDAARMRTHAARFGRPFVRLKAAATLDGKIATRDGKSQWITGPQARAIGHSLRWAADGVLVGIGTALADDPRLTVRDAPGPKPTPQRARIVLDSTARLPLAARCLAADGARRILIVGSAAPETRVAALREMGVEIVAMPTARPEAGAFLPALLKLGIGMLLVEGGAQVHGSLIAQGSADDLWLFLAGSVMGDSAAPAWSDGLAGGSNAVGNKATGNVPGGLAGETRPERQGLSGLPRLKLAQPLLLEGGDLLVRGEFVV